jgi:hypothetical protein
MTQQSPEEAVVFRVSVGVLIIAGIFASVFLALGIIIAITRGDWTVLAVIGAATAIFYALLHYLRLEVRPGGFTYRNLSMNRSIEFAEVEKAYFETMVADVAPQGVATFWVQLRRGRPIKINLRTFPLRAAASLLTALELQGIPIEVPESWAAQRMARQIRKEQPKLRS